MDLPPNADRRARVDAGCRAKGISVAELAKRIGRPRQFLYAVLSGTKPGTGIWEDLSKEIGCTVEWLTVGSGPAPTWWQASATERASDEASGTIPAQPAAIIEAEDREVPVLGRVAANSERWGEIEQPELKHHHFKRSLALVQVMGDSAYPVAFPGQFVVVDTDRKVNDQNLVVVVLNDGRALLKRYCAIPGEPTRMLLASVNIGLGSLIIDRSAVRYLHPVVGVMFE